MVRLDFFGAATAPQRVPNPTDHFSERTRRPYVPKCSHDVCWLVCLNPGRVCGCQTPEIRFPPRPLRHPFGRVGGPARLSPHIQPARHVTQTHIKVPTGLCWLLVPRCTPPTRKVTLLRDKHSTNLDSSGTFASRNDPSRSMLLLGVMYHTRTLSPRRFHARSWSLCHCTTRSAGFWGPRQKTRPSHAHGFNAPFGPWYFRTALFVYQYCPPPNG